MFINHDIENINSIIYKYLPSELDKANVLEKAVEDAVKNGGKRIRPLLMIKAFSLYSDIDAEKIGAYFSALEYIHCFSLIHDDLPCIDNDTLRRGKPTTWVSYGEDIAVLAGDTLALHAMKIIMDDICSCENNNIQVNNAIRAAKVLMDKAGAYGMIYGETIDVINTGMTYDSEDLEYMYSLKTAALIEAALMMGACLGGASSEDVKIMEKIGYNIGLAFQIADDILDVTKTSEELGKNANSDIDNNKTTYISLYGYEKSSRKLITLSNEAMDLLDELNIVHDSADKLNDIKNIIKQLIYREK